MLNYAHAILLKAFFSEVVFLLLLCRYVLTKR